MIISGLRFADRFNNNIYFCITKCDIYEHFTGSKISNQRQISGEKLMFGTGKHELDYSNDLKQILNSMDVDIFPLYAAKGVFDEKSPGAPVKIQRNANDLPIPCGIWRPIKQILKDIK